ncbi:COMM domain-containing protein 2 [Hondaea fermentalgiana]|uniref:COMM domain-containing protein 2 n=1 Tax=Hondaea fermentalgiana TaxID=2315210 RepID=A0A2R5G5H7_9STRA|nr:COMM domain-containing protein 2 [Hondaea fermentalgiana]|eukprot:GBG26286.1 COMM domain-containing protein 2 [Hondaea fermentalgiana]
MKISSSVAEGAALLAQPAEREAAVKGFLQVVLEAVRAQETSEAAVAQEKQARKKIAKAARALQEPVQAVERCFSAFARLLLECARERPERDRFLDVVAEALPFTPETCIEVFDFYKSHEDELADALEAQRDYHGRGVLGSIPWCEDFRWRLDVQIASRRSANCVQPNFVLRFDTSDGKSHALQSSAAGLAHIHCELSDALAQLDTVHVQRIPWWSYVIFWPFHVVNLVLVYSKRFIFRRHVPLASEVLPDLWVGTYFSDVARAVEWQGIVDLTTEFSERRAKACLQSYLVLTASVRDPGDFDPGDIDLRSKGWKGRRDVVKAESSAKMPSQMINEMPREIERPCGTLVAVAVADRRSLQGRPAHTSLATAKTIELTT